ncbi:SAM-dependent methyltransferase [Streptomyces sp. NBC_01221]|uniref:HsdM family class I SAM-dependent methyltransferase n=1 Tax=unclassified Streptomyces TaxID=2593676 RepID=UPI002254A843|nr:N-6 DNA methylase [Streptomyces sp. NBC_01221]MCX4789381.1 SAM-dependent methyltransferase [Streptomyces sp. NBC_01221]WSP57524.1 SAM-dependent methyltransferase [Streptomyces sp. NBC_01241]
MVNGFGQSNGSAAGTGIPPESSWTEASITARLWKFYREKTSTRAITQLQFVEHIGYLLFLKLDHERANRSSKFARKPVAPVDAWPNLVLLSGEALHTGLSSLMKKLGDQALVDHPGQQTASMVFRDAQPWPLDRMAELAKLITDEIDPYQWRTAPQAELGQAFSSMLRDCAEDIDRKIDTGQTLTPVPVLNAVNKVLGVGPDDIVIDPACGTGTTLIAAHKAMQSHDRSAIAGADLDPQMCRLATMNILLNTVRPFSDPAPVRLADTLTRKFPIVRAESGVNPTVAICNPPFKSNGVVPDSTMRDDFLAYGDFPTNFLQHLMVTLPKDTRAAVFVPDGVLFGSGAAATVRRALLKNCDVHTLLRLPTGLFHRKGVKSNILFFTVSTPRPDQKAVTGDLWVYDARTGNHHTDTGNPVTEEDFDDFIAACLPADGFAARTKSKRFRRYPVNDLLDRPKTNLDLPAYLAPDVEDFGSPKEIAFEVASQLDEAAAHFRKVAEALP